MLPGSSQKVKGTVGIGRCTDMRSFDDDRSADEREVLRVAYSTAKLRFLRVQIPPPYYYEQDGEYAADDYMRDFSHN